MPSEKILAAKKQVVANLVETYKNASTFVFVAARGLTVAQDTEMRNELRKNGVKYEVVKNTTLKLVFKELGIDGLDELFEGPTAVAYSEDLIAPAKYIKKFADSFEPLQIKGGVIEGKVASIDEITTLAMVPDKETLYSQVVYGLLFPFTKLAMLVKAVAEKKQEESGEAAPVETPAVEEQAPAAEETASVEETPAEAVAEVSAEA